MGIGFRFLQQEEITLEINPLRDASDIWIVHNLPISDLVVLWQSRKSIKKPTKQTKQKQKKPPQTCLKCKKVKLCVELLLFAMQTKNLFLCVDFTMNLRF